MRLGVVHTALLGMGLALAGPTSAQAMDAGRIDALVDQARNSGCVLPDAGAALEGAGVIQPDAREDILNALVNAQKADRFGPAVVLDSAVCHDGPAPSRRDRFLAVMGQGGSCVQRVDGLKARAVRYALTSRDVDLMRAEMMRHDEISLSADGTSLEVAPALCDQAKSLAETVVPDARAAFVAFMAANDCRIGTRDLPGAIADAGLEPAATDVVIEALVSDGDAIYYGFEQTLILQWERCA
ncbi:hypothetical protein O4H61_01370 [Roseovarius aestuarii]|nr:hypothetical protein [Roseovarius aestuarii]